VSEFELKFKIRAFEIYFELKEEKKDKETFLSNMLSPAG
jgi:hypothetical protein